jgi:hypothetical protein
MLSFLRPVVPLPKLTTPSAADLAAKAKAQPASQALLKPGMTSSEYIHALQEKKQSLDAVNALAHGMPERDAVSWAAQSSQKVAAKLNPQEQAAAKAAEAWVKNPSDATKAAAAEAASKTDFKGPGGWAAQAAAWAQSPAPATGSAPAGAPTGAAAGGATATPAAPPLTPAAVAGAVLLAAGLSNAPPMAPPQKSDLKAQALAMPKGETPPMTQAKPPLVDQSKMAKALQPFIDLGKNIASGRNTFA